MMYYRARYMMPEIGRFIQEDPVAGFMSNPFSFNKYIYGYNNPIKYADPNGEFGIIASILIAGAISGTLNMAFTGSWDVATFTAGFKVGAVGAAVAITGAWLGVYLSGATVGTAAAMGYGALGGAIAGGAYGYATTGTIAGAILGATAGAVGGAYYGMNGFAAFDPTDTAGASIDATKSGTTSIAPTKQPPPPPPKPTPKPPQIKKMPNPNSQCCTIDLM
jgi:hypothetical protein